MVQDDPKLTDDMIVERYPKSKGVVGSLVSGCEIFFLLKEIAMLNVIFRVINSNCLAQY